MRVTRACGLVLATLAAAVGLTACGGGSDEPTQASAADFDPASFSDSTTIDNEWWPLEPGTKFVTEGHTEEDGERIPHRLTSVVTDLTKTIAGVPTVVLWEVDESAGEVVEAEIAFFAQDDDGNVWRIGEYPEEYEEGKFVAAPAWLHGVDGALAGIAMTAEPALGFPDYSQGFAPEPISFTDRAQVKELGGQTCIPLGCYDDVLIMDEFNPDEPGKHQLKYYARGVGNVRVGWSGAQETSRETLVLVERTQLSPEELAAARAEALKLEARAHELKKAMFATTEPARAREES